MNPEVAVDSFKNTYINNYRKDVNEFYQEDIKNGVVDNFIQVFENSSFYLKERYCNGITHLKRSTHI